MPDAVARKAVDGANAFIRPLELIKTDGAVPVKVQGLYLIGSSVDATSPQVLYSPYHEGITSPNSRMKRASLPHSIRQGYFRTC